MIRLASFLAALALAGFGVPPASAQLSEAPARIVLLVDSSSAVGRWVNDFRAGLNAFVDALPGEDEIALITTGGQLRVRVPPSSDRQPLRTAIAGFFPDGGANALLESLLESDKRFLKTDPTKWPVFVLVTTDIGITRGDPNLGPFNKFTQDFVSRRGNAYAIVIRGQNVGLTSNLAMNLANNTSGFFETMSLATSLPDKMKTVAELIALDYHPRAPRMPGLGR